MPQTCRPACHNSERNESQDVLVPHMHPTLPPPPAGHMDPIPPTPKHPSPHQAGTVFPVGHKTRRKRSEKVPDFGPLAVGGPLGAIISAVVWKEGMIDHRHELISRFVTTVCG